MPTEQAAGSSPSCPLATRGSRRRCPKLRAPGGAPSRGAAPGRAGLRDPRGGSSSWGSRRSSPSPAFPAITWCGGGSAPGAFKEVAPRCRTWDWAGRRWVWGTEPSRRPGRGPRLCPAGAHTCPAPPTQAAAGARLPAVPWFRSRDPPGPRTLAHPSPKGHLAAPLNTLLHPHWEATAAKRGTDLPKVTKAGRAPSYLHGRVSAPSQLDAFGSRSLRGCLGDPGPAWEVQGDGSWLGLDSGAAASVAPGAGAE